MYMCSSQTHYFWKRRINNMLLYNSFGTYVCVGGEKEFFQRRIILTASKPQGVNVGFERKICGVLLARWRRGLPHPRQQSAGAILRFWYSIIMVTKTTKGSVELISTLIRIVTTSIASFMKHYVTPTPFNPPITPLALLICHPLATPSAVCRWLLLFDRFGQFLCTR